MPSPYDYMQNRWLNWHEGLVKGGEMSHGDPGDYVFVGDEVMSPIEAALRKEREQCCSDVCDACAMGWPVNREARSGGSVDWWHPDEACDAYRIRERAFKEHNEQQR